MENPKDKDQENKEPAFKVQDRRRFSSEGETKADGEESAERVEVPPLNSSTTESPKPEQVTRPSSAKSAGPSARPEPNRGGAAPAPELTFAAFVWSLSEQALAALGEIPDPATGKVTHDLIMAQQMIDIIIMLRDKTRGNLDQDEQTLVQEILSTLQMKYVELARQPGR
ncbi:MAG TPA: DUF1844 domain-containing protein [Sporolactobacillaceae bacterium]|nr:DUF1844 domain-containing protein [Sporolactobacillaceae bacterium]